MAKPVTHLSRIRTVAGRTITGTICNRMIAGEINCSTDGAEISCKLCLRQMEAFARFVSEAKAIKADIAREQA
jgi:hypothetical protein